MKIILAHGVLGFGKIDLKDRFSYFKGVAQKLQSLGHQVLAPSVSPIGTIENRARTLANNIVTFVNDRERALVIAHSMGGLDARYAISRIEGVASRIGTLVTIGTPHFGSPIADLIDIAPELFFGLDKKTALHDLTTGAGKDFDKVHDDHGVTIHCIAGIGRSKSLLRTSLAFSPTYAFMAAKGLDNDGMVPLDSASRGAAPWDTWPTDHADEIGWNLDKPAAAPAEEHLERYVNLVRRVEGAR